MPKRNSASFGVRNLICALLFLLFTAPAAAQTIPSGSFGSLNYWGVGGLSTVLNPGLAGQCLTTQGVGSAPVWVNCQVSQLSLLPSINTNQFYCNTSGQFAPPLGCDVNAILNTVGYDISRPPLVESILYKSNVGPTFNWQTLPPGTQGAILTSGGPTNPPFWSPTPTQANLASICTTVGALLYFDTPSNLWKCLNPGTAGQLLQTNGPGANPSYMTLTATAPLSVSGGNISTTTGTLTSSNDTNVTITLGGSPTNALFNAVSLTMGWTGTLSIARGGTGAGTQQAALNNIAPTPTRAGDVIFWNGSNWVNFAGNNSGTQVLSENASGVPAWSAAGSGTVQTLTAGTEISFSSGATCTTNCTINLNPTAPQVSILSGSGTYTTPVGATRVVFTLVGGGGGGSGSGSNGGAGGDTCINTSGAACTSPVLDAGGGKGSAGAGVGGLGGTVSGSTACNMLSVQGGNGGGSASIASQGSMGGNSILGGAGGGAPGGAANTGIAGQNGTGGGGGGGTSASAAFQGGGAGAGCKHMFTSPAASYTYAVGAAGTAGTTGGTVGGTGTILAEAYFN